MHASWQQKCSSRQKRGLGIRPPALEKMANAPEISAPLSTLKHVIVMEKTSAKPGLTEPCEAASSSAANSDRLAHLFDLQHVARRVVDRDARRRVVEEAGVAVRAGLGEHRRHEERADHRLRDVLQDLNEEGRR